MTTIPSSKKALYFSLVACILAGSRLCLAQKTHHYILASTQPPALMAAAGEDIVFTPDALIQLGGDPTVSGGTVPYTYLWTPGENLSDSEESNPIVTAADEDVTYTLTVIDNAGCEATDKVTVFAEIITSVPSGKEVPFTISPNPVKEWIVIRTGERGGILTLLDSQGKPILKESLKPVEHSLDTRNLPRGVYFLNISINQETHTVKLLVP